MSGIDDLFNSIRKESDYLTLKARLEGRGCNTCGKIECDGWHMIAKPCEKCGSLHMMKQFCPKEFL